MKKFIFAMAATIIISVGAIGITASALATVSSITIDYVKTDRTTFSTDNPKSEEVYPDSF